MREIPQDSPSLDFKALEALETSQKELLDTIDDIRSMGVGNIVDLPQIIVVGDQNAGKSSVLEAISRVRFPVKGDVCTRFATELVLRKSPAVQAGVRIIPAPDDSIEMKKRLESFKKSGFRSDDLPDLVTEAKRHMKIHENNGFSRRTLVIEISGPNVPSLTLVDLPGFYRASSDSQSDEDRDLVNGLAASYMSKPSSIILAVLGLDTQVIQQGVLTEIKKHDPERRRTIGIITKPDSPAFEERRTEYVQLARNQNSKHHLMSWHVLRNKSQAEAGISDQKRDELERQLLEQGVWKTFPDADKGIASLRTKLSEALLSHIRKSLPKVVGDIEAQIAAREAQKASLGNERESAHQCRRYLEDIHRKFEKLVTEATEGSYNDYSFFYSDPSVKSISDDYNKRKLRKYIGDLNRTFVAVMAAKGSARTVQWHDPEDFVKDLLPQVPTALQGAASAYMVEEPIIISEDELIAEVTNESKNYRGRDFPGTPSSRLSVKLFVDDSRKWRSIANRHVELAVDGAHEAVLHAFFHLIKDDNDTRAKIIETRVDPFFKRKRQQLEAKVHMLLPHCSATGFAQAHVTEFEQRIYKRAHRRLHRQIEGLINQTPAMPDHQKKNLRQHTELATMAAVYNQEKIYNFSEEMVIDNAVEYYGMTLRSFTENVVILAIENDLMGDMASAFTGVLDLTDEELLSLASESTGSSERRRNLEDDIATLKSALEKCKIQRRSGFSSNGTKFSTMRVNGNGAAATNGTKEVGGNSVKEEGL